MKMLMTKAARFLAVAAIVAGLLASVPLAQAAQPDYSPWNMILTKYYDPAKGMDYKSLKAKDAGTVAKLRQSMAKVDVASLNKKEQLAYWINLYNINVVGIILDNYPVKSIRAISTDPITRVNVFKKDYVPFGSGMTALGKIEDDKIREGFKDPRIHFAINCAARSCPPIRTEAFVGERLDAQLDDQARRFLNGPNGVKISKKGDTTIVETTKIMAGGFWFEKDFKAWGNGTLAFMRKYVSADKAKMIDQAGENVKVTYDDYNWDLNDWLR